MKRLVPAVFLLASLAVACGSEDEKPSPGGEGGSGGTGGTGPAAPTFAGLDEVRFAAPSTAQLFWLPATDAETPASEIEYRISVWASDPARVDAAPDTYDFLGSVDTDCNPRCRYNYGGLAAGDVRWFAVEAIDADGMSAGGQLVVPGAILAAPVVDQIEPATADVGTLVVVQGQNLLDERIGDDGLTLGGKPIDREFVQAWDNRAIRVLVPAGHGSGPLELKVTTLGGSATGTLTVNE